MLFSPQLKPKEIYSCVKSIVMNLESIHLSELAKARTGRSDNRLMKIRHSAALSNAPERIALAANCDTSREACKFFGENHTFLFQTMNKKDDFCF